jgi:hypothetical protein
VTLRYKSTLLHIGVGRAYNRQPVLMLVRDRDVQILNRNGELIRQLKIDPSRIYQPQGG